MASQSTSNKKWTLNSMQLTSLTNAIISGNEEETEELVKMALENRVDPSNIFDALIKGIHDIGDKWSRLEVFIPEVMKASYAMKAGMRVLTPNLKEEDTFDFGTILLGTVKGDMHDIGKNIVGAMLSSSGFTVCDIGVNNPAITFVEKAREVNADIIAASSLLTTSIQGQKDIIELLTTTGERNRFYVMVGGGPVTQEWCDYIGADGYGEIAADAVQLAKQFINKKQKNRV